MTDLVPTSEIEQIVGARRHDHQHLGRGVSADQKVYILHSRRCLESGIDLRDCQYSKCLDSGIDHAWWRGLEDRVVVLAPIRAQLIPVLTDWLPDYVTDTEKPTP